MHGYWFLKATSSSICRAVTSHEIKPNPMIPQRQVLSLVQKDAFFACGMRFYASKCLRRVSATFKNFTEFKNIPFVERIPFVVFIVESPIFQGPVLKNLYCASRLSVCHQRSKVPPPHLPADERAGPCSGCSDEMVNIIIMNTC